MVVFVSLGARKTVANTGTLPCQGLLGRLVKHQGQLMNTSALISLAMILYLDGLMIHETRRLFCSALISVGRPPCLDIHESHMAMTFQSLLLSQADLTLPRMRHLNTMECEAADKSD